MIFSKACEYGIKATLYIAQKSLKGQRVMLKDIAEEINSPAAFTAKILQQLSRENVVQSLKGPTGGFFIEREDISKINLKDIVLAIDGNKIFTRCGIGLEKCSESHPCPVHDEYKKIRMGMEKMLETTGLVQMATGIENRTFYLKR